MQNQPSQDVPFGLEEIISQACAQRNADDLRKKTLGTISSEKEESQGASSPPPSTANLAPIKTGTRISKRQSAGETRASARTKRQVTSTTAPLSPRGGYLENAEELLS